MNREILKRVIADQKEQLLPKTLFDRSKLKEIRKFLDDPSIVILSGVRRSGKSTLMRMLREEQEEADYFLNFDDDRLVQFALADFQTLLEVFGELFGSQSTIYFDEIQNIKGWERFVRRLYEQGNKIFITGSNAKLLSRELGTHLTGRYIQIEVYPLSFMEIVLQENNQLLTKNIFSTSEVGSALNLLASYVKNGGIPEYYKFRKSEYLKSLYEGIIYRDIVSRHNISNDKPLRQMVLYFASHIGKEFSYTKLGAQVGLSSPHTVSKYCSYLEDCYLCFFVSRYSHSLRKQIQYNKKCYMIDTAVIQQIGFRVSGDQGRMLENMVFLALKMRGEEVYFHKEQNECDFIVRRGNCITQAIQVTTHLETEKIRDREFSGLLEAMRTYELTEGLIITENDEEQIEVDGYPVHIVPAWKWLLCQNSLEN